MKINRLINDMLEENKKTSINIQKEQDIESKNKIAISDSNSMITQVRRCMVFTSNLESLESLVVDDNHKYYYKQWETLIFTASTVSEAEYILDLISANISYNIYYQPTVQQFLDYYNTGEEIRECSFLTLKDRQIIFTVSLFIQKPFGGEEITIPQVKLITTVTPFARINS